MDRITELEVAGEFYWVTNILRNWCSTNLNSLNSWQPEIYELIF